MDGLSIPGAIVASGVAAVWTALGVNKSRKRDADKDRDQRKQIADAQLDVASRQADIAAQAVTEATADRKQQAAVEARRAKEADGTLKALTELLRRTDSPSPPGAGASESAGPADPEPDPGAGGPKAPSPSTS